MTDDQTKKASRRWWWIGGGAAAVLVVAAVSGDGDKATPGEAGTVADSPASVAAEAPAPITKVSAVDLATAYDANQLSAAKLYADRPLEVSGTVTTIDESLGDPTLHLDTVKFLPVYARFPTDATDRLATLSKGAKVLVRCDELSEAVGILGLNGCQLVE